jgi:hypothetical protein
MDRFRCRRPSLGCSPLRRARVERPPPHRRCKAVTIGIHCVKLVQGIFNGDSKFDQLPQVLPVTISRCIQGRWIMAHIATPAGLRSHARRQCRTRILGDPGIQERWNQDLLRPAIRLSRRRARLGANACHRVGETKREAESDEPMSEEIETVHFLLSSGNAFAGRPYAGINKSKAPAIAVPEFRHQVRMCLGIHGTEFAECLPFVELSQFMRPLRENEQCMNQPS